MNHSEQAAWLNTIVKLKLAPSPIHGIGVFATADIGKGDKVFADVFPQLYSITFSSFGKLFPQVRDQLLERWPTVTKGSAFWYPDTFLQGYMNHSDDPNYDAVTDTALRDIKAGEEVTEDYRKIPGYQQVYPWLDEEEKQRVIK